MRFISRFLALCGASMAAAPSFGQPGTTLLVSVAGAGAPGDHQSWQPSISADGRFVAFGSSATNLVRGDTDWSIGVFYHERAVFGTSVSGTVTLGDLPKSGPPALVVQTAPH